MMNKRSKKIKPPETALGNFGFKSDVFSTLPLRQEQLGFFIGHQEEVDRLRDGIFSRENCALVGEPGSGKSSLMERVRAELKRDCEVVSIGVPVADGAYFLRELLQQLLVSLNRKLLKRVNFRSLGMELRREGDRLSKSKLKSMVLPLLQGYSKPLVIFVVDL
jgi:predicted ATP-dependent serine protease